MTASATGLRSTDPADAARRAVAATWRVESTRIVGSLARFTGDFALAEDVAQEALTEALVSWPRTGVPDRPGAWLLTTARRRAIDAFRRRVGRDDRYEVLATTLARADEDGDLLWDPDRVPDDVLALMFVSCHPALSREAQIALTLRTVGGLTTEEIARAFLVPIPTIQARITRAKKTLAAAQVPFAVPPVEERSERVGSVLNTLYVIFTEGSSATSGDTWMRTDLAGEALRLARALAHLQPDPEVFGLVALMELTSARFPARVDEDGRPVLLEDQDRRRWDRTAITRGKAALARASGPDGLGAYGLQAAIAECHAVAASVADTDWEHIVVLYEALGRLAPSPIIELNRAVAVSMACGPAAGLVVVDELSESGALARFHLLYAVRGELLSRLGRHLDARADFLRASELCENAAERELLLAKAGRPMTPGSRRGQREDEMTRGADVVTVEDVRRWALGLPEVEEGTHFRLPSLKVRDKGFVLIEKGDASVLLSVDQEAARAAADADSSTYEEVWRNDRTIFVGVRAQLATADAGQIEALVEAAWRNKAPKRLVASFDSASGGA